MSRTLLTALAACAAAAFIIAPARADELLTVRHGEHLAGSAVMAGALTAYTRSEAKAFELSLAVGLAKEVYDQTQYPRAGFTCQSLLADAVGSYVGAKFAGVAIQTQPHGFSIVLRRTF